MIKRVICFTLFMRLIYLCQSLKILSTNSIKITNGNLPSGYDNLTFSIYNGNWSRHVTLPTHPIDGNTVIIRSFTSKTTTINVTHVDVPLNKWNIERVGEYCFIFRNSMKKWVVTGKGISYLTPKMTGHSISEIKDKLTFYSIEDDAFASVIKLPAKAIDGAYVVIRSGAFKKSEISKTNMLYASTTTIIKNDEYVLKYLSAFKGWVIETAPVRTVRASSVDFQLAYPTSQHTVVIFSNGNWISKIKLPEEAGDRDKVSIRSSAIYTSTIDPSNVNTPGAMKLHLGEKYDFFYIAENRKWQLMAHPDTLYEAKDIANGKVAELTRPRTIIKVSNGNYHSHWKLPPKQSKGSRVIFRTSADWNFEILADGKTYVISKGEIVSFKVNEINLWIRETITIDYLLLYGNKTASVLKGEDNVRKRLIYELNKTNEALENSGANFRFRALDIRPVPEEDWKLLGDALIGIVRDPTVQNWRNELKADGIYYIGTQEGCGLGYRGAYEGESWMVATESINCGNDAMRHELGHNMGLWDMDTNKFYGQGYSLLRTIMAGNDVPYYSTPHRYTLDYGIPMGITDKIDAVRAMNEVSSHAAAFR